MKPHYNGRELIPSSPHLLGSVPYYYRDQSISQKLPKKGLFIPISRLLLTARKTDRIDTKKASRGGLLLSMPCCWVIQSRQFNRDKRTIKRALQSLCSVCSSVLRFHSSTPLYNESRGGSFYSDVLRPTLLPHSVEGRAILPIVRTPCASPTRGGRGRYGRFLTYCARLLCVGLR